MEDQSIVLVKLGGSVITDKDVVEKVDEFNLVNIVRQIAKSGRRVIVVHGAGSFGHPKAKELDLIQGVVGEEVEQLKRQGVSYTRHRVQLLNERVVREFVKIDLPAFSVAPSSMFLEHKEGEYEFDPRIVLQLLDDGFIPVLFGDMVLSTSRHFTVLSGDKIMYMIAKELKKSGYNLEEVIYVSDVDGLYTSNPKENKDAKLIGKITLDEMEEKKKMASASSSVDVTKGMLGKLLEVEKFLRIRLPVTIINHKDDRLYQLLTGEKVTGSYFLP